MSTSPEELSMLREAVRTWVSTRAPLSALRDDGPEVTRDRWREMAQLGWTGIVVDVAHDGAGLGYEGLGVLLRELGHQLLPQALLSSALAAATLQVAGSDAQKARWLPAIVGGTPLAVAVGEHARESGARPPMVLAQRRPSGWTLRGTKKFVPDAGAAQMFIVAARTAPTPGGEVMLFLVEAAKVAVARLEAIDGRDYAHLEFEEVELPDGARLAADQNAAAVAERIQDLGCTGLAADMLGCAERALDITVDYLRTRKQFGQFIGAFQALQHRAALMLVDLELARSCVDAALAAADQDSAELSALASLAKAMVGEALHRVSNEIVQLHGGIGMTAEHVAGRFLKRARVAEALFGNTAYHADRYAQLRGF